MIENYAVTGAIISASLLLFLWLLYRYTVRRVVSWWHEDIDDGSLVPVEQSFSLVVVSQNSGADIERNIPLLLEQKGVSHEVIVVNAASSDTTCDAVKRLTLDYPQLRQTYVPQSSANLNVWELACMLGARAARHEWVLFVNPGFVAPSDHWLLDLAQYVDSTLHVLVEYAYRGDAEAASWGRRFVQERKMARTALRGRAIDVAGGNVLVQRDWYVARANDTAERECLYLYRDSCFWNRVILRVRSHRLSDAFRW